MISYDIVFYSASVKLHFGLFNCPVIAWIAEFYFDPISPQT